MEKTIFITGSSSGIGRETALFFAEKGWNVIATMRNPQDKGFQGQKNICCLHLDVTDPASIREAVAAAVKRFPQIDVLLNNAGYALNGIFESMTPEQIEKQFATNVFGLMQVTREILPHFRKQGNGTIINIASVGGRVGFPLYSIYQAAKFAVEGFSEALIYELQPLDIKVRLIEPGVIITDFYTRSMDFGAGTNLTDYALFEKKAKKAQEKVSKQGSKPVKVARIIYKAATCKGRRLRFPVGADARLLFFMKKILPFSWFRALITRVMVG